MLLTEKEAGEKWCPHVRIAVEGGGSANADGAYDFRNPPACRCIASGCAMWRFDKQPMRKICACPPPNHLSEHEPLRPIHIPSSWEFTPYDGDGPACWVEPDDELQARTRGYCGLAGRPGATP